MTIQEAKEMVAEFLISEPKRSKKISDFQKFIWKDKSAEIEEDLYEILNCLAYDLDYYEPNPEWRRECPGCYYDEQGLVTNIEEALQAIEALEIKNQNIQNDKD